MEIIIAGAGRVGFRLATLLSVRHNVVIMDKNSDALEKLRESIDALTIVGNVQDPNTYEPLSGREVDLFIAVTDVDEVNLISAIIAGEKIRVAQKIIRLNHPFFAQSAITEKLAITHAVYPYTQTANSVRALLEYPKANNVKSFPETSMKLVSVKVDFHRGIHSLPVSELENRHVAVVGLERKKNFRLVGPADAVQHDDMVYLFGEAQPVRDLCGRLNHAMPASIRKIAIFGADALGIEIARQLGGPGMTIKLIEKDLEKCRRAAEELQEMAMVINSKYGDSRLYQDEGLGSARMMIAATPNDEENIIKCIEARQHGVGKVVAINNDTEYYNLMHSLGITVVRGPKTNTFYSVIEAIGSNAVVNERLFCGGAAICFIRRFGISGCQVEASAPRALCAYHISEGGIAALRGTHTLAEGDAIVLFCARAKEEEARAWINAL